MHSCCMTDRSKSAIMAEAGQKLRAVSVESIEIARNSSSVNSVKKQMLTGHEPEQCRHCYSLERSGGQSLRKVMNYEFEETFNRISDEKKLDQDSRFEFIDLRFGNVCNLACRMCSPESSVKLSGEWSNFHGRPIGKVTTVSPEILRFVLKNSENLKRVSCLGGEPFLIKEVEQFLKDLVATGYANNIKLTFNSNLTLINHKIVELWPHFKSTLVGASIDGFGSVNNYIRHPSNWETIDHNLKTLKKLCILYINTTVQIYNLFHLKELLDYAISENVRLKLTILQRPNYLSIQALPANLKNEAAEYLDQLLIYTQYAQDIKAIKDFLFQKDQSNQFGSFVKWTHFLDQSRDQKLEEFNLNIHQHIQETLV
jgi:sulfatase maturation enzyme AslB (radical SAM superfamily)